MISIITISLNSEKTIERTMRSVLDQSFRDIEYIIVDGNSTDNTHNIIDELLYENENNAQPLKIKVYKSRDNGISDAFNKGLLHSNGNFLIYLNSDDYFISTTIIEECNKLLINDEEIYCGNIKILENNKTVNSRLRKFGFEHEIMHPSTFIGKKVFKKVGGFNEEYKISMDFDFFIRCRANNIIFNLLSKTITIFSVDGISSNQISKLLNENNRIRRIYFFVMY